MGHASGSHSSLMPVKSWITTTPGHGGGAAGTAQYAGMTPRPVRTMHFRGRLHTAASYLSCCRRTISVIQTGANGDVQFGGVG